MAFSEISSEVSKSPEASKLSVDPDKPIGSDTKEPKREISNSESHAPIDADKPIEGKKIYTDDNGNQYRIGNELIPSNQYEVNGYTYQTDSHGRVKSAEGQLHIDETPRKYISSSMESIGKGDQQEGDQRGHLIGDKFGGGNGLENIVAMNGKVNQGDYKAIENKCAKALGNDREVHMKIVPKYEGVSHRPTAFRITYIIDGEKTVATLKNEGGSQK